MEVEKMIYALGIPIRYQIFQALLERRHCVRSLAKKMNVSEAAISQHLKIMKEAGLVYGEKYGYHTHYMPRQEAIDLICEKFQRMREQSIKLKREEINCQCEYREEKKV